VVSKSVVAKMPAMPKKAVLSAAVTSLASQALPALAVVDERLNGDGTGLIFGVNDESLGFILLLVPTLIFGHYTANTKDDDIMAGGKDDDSGLSL
jgi:photosystem II PsbW protein